MIKHYIIEDLQTQEFSSFTTVKDMFDYCIEDYMTNFWSPEEQARLEAEFAEADEEYMMSFVEEVYEYKFHSAPDPLTVEEWEEYTGRKWEEEKVKEDE